MASVTASYIAVAAVYGSEVAVNAVKANETAWATLTGASSEVMGKAVAVLAGLNPDSYADMAAVAASSTAMAAVIANSTALNAVVSSSTAMTAVAASQTAMTAVAASSTAMAAVTASPTAMAAIATSSMATAKYAASAAGLNPADYDDMTELAASSTAMTAVAASSTAMTAVAASTTAATAIEASSTAISALGNSPLKVTDSGGYGHTNSKRTVRSGRAFVISVKFGTSSNTNYYGNITTFLLGSSPYRATCTAATRAINRFATQIVCYGEYTSSLNDNVNYSQVVYIPC